MVFNAHMDEMPQPGSGRQRATRRTVRLELPGVGESAGEANVLVHNISATGLLIESGAGLEVGEAITIELPEAGSTLAKVVWSSGTFHGCQFHDPIPPAALSAVQLRSPATPEQAPAFVNAPTPRRDESFGIRLRRLRTARGLTMTRVATALGVSKPTVWAWENGKARPSGHRIGALVSLLGVSEEELIGGRDDEGLRELISRCREQIAEAVGARVENIRILIEL